jgi:hypothetical protein
MNSLNSEATCSRTFARGEDTEVRLGSHRRLLQQMFLVRAELGTDSASVRDDDICMAANGRG